MQNEENEIEEIINLKWTDLIEEFISLHKQGKLVALIDPRYSEDMFKERFKRSKIKNDEKVIDISLIRKNKFSNIKESLKEEFIVKMGLGILSIIEIKIKMITFQFVGSLMSFDELMSNLEEGYKNSLKFLKENKINHEMLDIFEGFDIVTSAVSRNIIDHYVLPGDIEESVDELESKLGVDINNVDYDSEEFMNRIFRDPEGSSIDNKAEKNKEKE